MTLNTKKEKRTYKFKDLYNFNKKSIIQKLKLQSLQCFQRYIKSSLTKWLIKYYKEILFLKNNNP